MESPEELREWVLQGMPSRLKKNPAARFFLDRQLLKMPAYEKHVPAEELDQLVAYIEDVRRRR